MSRNELRTNDLAWRNGIKPTRVQLPQQRARSLYERAHEKARRSLLDYAQSIAPINGGAK